MKGRGARAPIKPYASIPATLLASRAYLALSGNAARLHLLLEAAWRPPASDRQSRWFLPQKQARTELKAGPATISQAFQELQAAKIIEKTKAGTRPTAQGGGRGEAAEYRLRHRENGAARTETNGVIVSGLPWKAEGDRSVQGKWRVHNDRLRGLAGKLAPAEAKVFLWFQIGPRKEDGSLIDNPPRSISGHDAVGLKLNPKTIQRAISRLVEEGYLIQVNQHAGRRAATHKLADRDARGVKRKLGGRTHPHG